VLERNGEMGRWGDGEMGRWGDGEMGRWGDGEMGQGVYMCVFDSRPMVKKKIRPKEFLGRV
jgi:hypothetical protein